MPTQPPTFSTTRRGGYSQPEVDTWVGRVLQQLQELERDLEQTRRDLHQARQEASEQVGSVMLRAQAAADLILHEARQKSEEMVQEARRLAEEAHREATEEAQRELERTQRDLEQTRQEAEQTRQEAEREARRAAEQIREEAEQEARRIRREAKLREAQLAAHAEALELYVQQLQETAAARLGALRDALGQAQRALGEPPDAPSLDQIQLAEEEDQRTPAPLEQQLERQFPIPRRPLSLADLVRLQSPEAAEDPQGADGRAGHPQSEAEGEEISELGDQPAGADTPLAG